MKLAKHLVASIKLVSVSSKALHVMKGIALLLSVSMFSIVASADCISPAGVQGQTQWISASSDIRYCDGTNWISTKYGKLSLKTTLSDTSPYIIQSPAAYATSGNNLFLVDSSLNRLYTIDLTNIYSPVVTNALNDAQFTGATRAEVSGSYLFITTSSKFLILNITTPTSPSIVGTLAAGYSRLFVSGNYAYVLSTSKFAIINITNKASPVEAGSVALTNAVALAIDGSYAYVSHSSGSMSIINISTPSSPSVTGTLSNANFYTPNGIAASGNYAYVTGKNGSSTGSLSIVNVTNKSAPVYVSSITGGSSTSLEGLNDVTRSGNYLFVTQSNGRNSTNYITTYDISNPASPVEIYETGIDGFSGANCNKIYIGSSRTVCTGSSDSSVYLFDSSAQNTLMSTPLATIASSDANSLWGMDVGGNYAAAIDGGEKLYIVDISNPANMIFKGSFASDHYTNVYSKALSIAFDGNYAYMGCYNWGQILVLDVVTNPSKPKLIKTLSGSINQVNGLTKSGNYLYAAGSNGLTIFDVTTPASATMVSHIDLFTSAYGSAEGVTVNGNYAYVSSTTSDVIAIVDITNKAAPSMVGSYTDATNLASVDTLAVSGNYIYAHGGGGRLVIIDATTKSSPTLVSVTTNTASYGGKFAVSGNYLYSSGTSGLTISDISNPLAPTVSKTFLSGGTAGFVSGTNLFAVTSNGIKSYNVTTPPSATLTQTYTITGLFAGISSVAASGNYAYIVASTRHQFHVVDVTDRLNPSVIWTITNATTLASAKGVAVSGNYAYVVGSNYITVIDITVPSAANIVGTLSDATNLAGAKDVYVSGNYAFVMTSSGVTVVNVATKTAPVYQTKVTSALMIGCTQMTPSGSYLFFSCSTSTSMAIVNISTPTSPILTGTYQDATQLAAASSIAVVGSYAYLGVTGGMTVMNVSNPASPSFVSTKPNGYGAINVVHNNSNFLFTSYGGYMVYMSIRSAPGPKWLQNFYCRACGSTIPRMASTTNNLYVISTGGYFQIWDISPKTVPPEQNLNYNLANKLDGARAIKVVGNFAYVLAPNTSRLTIADISNPAAPTIVGSIFDGSLASGLSVDVVGGVAYVTTNNSEYALVRVDVSTPASPTILGISNNFFSNWNSQKIRYVGSNYYWTSVSQNKFSSNAGSALSISGAPYGFDISGNYAFVCLNSVQTLGIVDISNPASLVSAGSLVDPLLAGCRYVEISGNYAYVLTSTSNALVIVDISSPLSPVIVGSLIDASFWSATDLKVVGNFVYVAASGKFYFVDVSDKASPSFADSISASLSGISVVGNLTFASNASSDRIEVYDTIPPIIMGTCSSSGEFLYDNSQNAYKFCNGSKYLSMGPAPGAGGAGCSSPAATKGTIRFNVGDLKLKYCDGTNWVNAGM